MILNDLEYSATKRIEILLREQFDYNIPTAKLTVPIVKKMLGISFEKLKEFRTRPEYFVSEKNQSYLRLLSATQFLSEWLTQRLQLNEYSNDIANDVFSALRNEGYTKKQAKDAVNFALQNNRNPSDFNSFFQLALNSKGKQVKGAAMPQQLVTPGNTNSVQGSGNNPPPIPMNKKSAADVIKKGVNNLGPHRVVPHVLGSAATAFYAGLKGQTLSPGHGAIQTSASSEPGPFKQGLRGQPLGPKSDKSKNFDQEQSINGPTTAKGIQKFVMDKIRTEFGRSNLTQQAEIRTFMTAIYKKGLDRERLEEKDLLKLVSQQPIFSKLPPNKQSILAKMFYSEIYAVGYHAY